MIGAKANFLLRPTILGSPKYFLYSRTVSAPNACLIDSWVSNPVLLLKKREVLSILIFCLEAASYKLS